MSRLRRGRKPLQLLRMKSFRIEAHEQLAENLTPLHCCGELYRPCSQYASRRCSRGGSGQAAAAARSPWSKRSCLTSATLEQFLRCVQAHHLVGIPTRGLPVRRRSLRVSPSLKRNATLCTDIKELSNVQLLKGRTYT